MDGYEATRIVFARIQNIDPENASKIMGLLLIQDHGEKEMIRLAFGPESLVHSVILKARKELGLSTASPTSNLSSSPSSPSPLFSRQNSSSSSSSSSRLGVAVPNPSWSSELPNTDDLVSPSSGSSSLNPASLPFYGNGAAATSVCDYIDEFQFQDHLSFLNDNTSPNFDSLPSPTGGAGAELFPNHCNGDGVHRRSCSVSDILDDPNFGFGWRPCLYFARGYCKNGSNCRFVHGGLGESDATSVVGSPSKIEMIDQCHELLRSKSAHQQRLAAASQLLGPVPAFPYSPKSMNFLLQQQQNDSHRAAAAAMMMGEDMHKLGRRFDRNDLVNPAARQIYLTFPADSTFREEDVSNYFSIYGPVQDVRIPYQQKRMFGFVTFVYPETVKIILAKGNPHFVCDARVLVKPYKEKGKVPDKKQPQPLERGELFSCGTSTGLDSRDPFDFGARMFYNNQDILWRRKLEEQTDLEQALELQSRRLMNLQLLDVKNHHHHRVFSNGSPIQSPTHSPSLFSQSIGFSQLHGSPEISPVNCSSPSPPTLFSAPLEKQTANMPPGKENDSNEESNEDSNHVEDNGFLESLEHNLPDSLFASPTEGSVDHVSAFNAGATEVLKDAAAPAPSPTNTSSITSSSSSLDMASFKSFNCQIPRFSSGPGSIGLYAGVGGPTCPIGI